MSVLDSGHGIRVSSPRFLCGLIPGDTVLGKRRACRAGRLRLKISMAWVGLAVLGRRKALNAKWAELIAPNL